MVTLLVLNLEENYESGSEWSDIPYSDAETSYSESEDEFDQNDDCKHDEVITWMGYIWFLVHRLFCSISHTVYWFVSSGILSDLFRGRCVFVYTKSIIYVLF